MRLVMIYKINKKRRRSFIHPFVILGSWEIIRKDEFRMTPFLGWVMRKEETTVCPMEIQNPYS